MFDDPRKELRRLENALQEEQTDELDLEALLEEEPAPARRPVRDFSRSVYDEPEDDDALVPDNDPKPKGIGALVVLALLELAGIVAIPAWWGTWVR